VKIIRVEQLIVAGEFPNSQFWLETQDAIHKAIREVDWPRGSGKFTIHPESGKGRGKGNGVKPIKDSLMAYLSSRGWKLEEPLDIATAKRPGELDAVLHSPAGVIALEWETGNISSSHRALNKMALDF